jgi:predicted RNase H-like nuclease (RuvC/YqgF family)
MSDKLKEALDAVAELGRLQGRVIALEALLENEKAENARLKAEVAELKSQPDPLTAYLYAAELAKDEIKRLKAEVERLKLTPKTFGWTDKTYIDKVEFDKLQAEVERLTKAGDAMAEQLDGLSFDSVWDFWNAAKEGKQS